jgi:hypothetical protein
MENSITMATKNDKKMLASAKLKNFTQALKDLCEPRGISVGPCDGPRKNDHVMKLLGKNRREILLHVKTSVSGPVWWGISPKIVGMFQKGGHQWNVVLLCGSGEGAYLGTSKEVEDGINSQRWSQASPPLGDYKVHEKEIADRFAEFDSYAELFLRLLLPATAGANLEAEAEAESFYAQERTAGFQPDSEIRTVVEEYAMKGAKEKLSGPEFGFSDFKDTSKAECYDYTCRRDGRLHYVEVKGTQGSGASVILTKNEVEHWKKHPKNSIAVIVHDVKVGLEGGACRASGGTSCVCLPWVLEPAALEPIQYTWSVPGRRGGLN